MSAAIGVRAIVFRGWGGGTGGLEIILSKQIVHCDYPVTEWLVGSLSSLLRPRQHSIGYMGDGFYRSKDPTNSIKVLKENLERKTTQRTQRKHKLHISIHTQNSRQIQHTRITQQEQVP